MICRGFIIPGGQVNRSPLANKPFMLLKRKAIRHARKVIRYDPRKPRLALGLCDLVLPPLR